MHTKRILILLLCAALYGHSFAQQKETAAEVDLHSLNLFNAGQWKTLLTYGKESLSSGIDFPLLRMRVGYAAYMLGNYGQSLKQYKTVLDADPSNAIALYYVYLNNLYLNNIPAARYYAGKLPPETKAAEKIHSVRLSEINGEFGYKMPQNNMRGNASYGRIGFGLQLGYRLELQQSGAIFNQQLSEPLLTRVINNTNINNNQKEYYAKLSFALSGRTSLMGGYHYIYTPFNNLVYNNHLVFGGVKYSSPFVQLKAMAAFGKMTDTSYSQYDLTVSTYPLGNTRLYTISRMAYGDAFTFSQVLGYRIAKPLWLEAHITLGHYNNLLENDALYVFNDIDQKQFKAGGSMYLSFARKGLFSVNYTFDQKIQYGGLNRSFYQHSLNTAISWKF